MHRINEDSAVDCHTLDQDPLIMKLNTNCLIHNCPMRNCRVVVHYQLPASMDTYIHRAGRTGRGLGREGVSVALVRLRAQGWGLRGVLPTPAPQIMVLGAPPNSASEAQTKLGHSWV